MDHTTNDLLGLGGMCAASDDAEQILDQARPFLCRIAGIDHVEVALGADGDLVFSPRSQVRLPTSRWH